MKYINRLNEWLESNIVDEETKRELKNIDDKEIEDRFYKSLDFGTGGLRGVIGAGTNRMNIYTVAKASQGLANYLIKEAMDKEASICIAYDSRNMSKEFAQIVARVMAASEIKVYMYDSLRPTPMLSFTVRELSASAGVVITASHNPAKYNGYKVYGPDGSQITDKAASEILSSIESCHIFDDVAMISLEEALEKDYLTYIGEDIDNLYYKRVEKLIVRKNMVLEQGDELNIIYTPIHGSGNIPVRTILKKVGFSNVSVVKEQEMPDGNFPTAPYPNPEERSVFDLSIEMAKEKDADIIIGTDPDCDRIGVIVKDKEKNYISLTGNQIGNLLTEYILLSREELKLYDDKDTVIKTIVTSQMANEICKKYGVHTLNVLTGFKYIGEKISEFEKTGLNNFILGFEESYGYLLGDFVRDKDAVIASALICEMALYYHNQGKSLNMVLQEMFEKYGYFVEELLSVEMEGKAGKERIDEIISTIRDEYPRKVGRYRIKIIEDYKSSKKHYLVSEDIQKITLPKSNVIKMILEDDSWLVIRPSGTEPKIKIYIGVTGKNELEVNNKLSEIKKYVNEILL